LGITTSSNCTTFTMKEGHFYTSILSDLGLD
jgi:hypothetical protein